MGGFSGFTTLRMQTDVIIHDYESHMFINISEDRAVEMYIEPEVQAFSKQLTKIQYVVTQKRIIY
jgi:hypothetical protein